MKRAIGKGTAFDFTSAIVVLLVSGWLASVERWRIARNDAGMQASATRMRSLIAALLDFSRITSEAQPFVEVDLAIFARQSDGFPGIAFSGYGMDHDIARGRMSGFFTNLTKPVDIVSASCSLCAS